MKRVCYYACDYRCVCVCNILQNVLFLTSFILCGYMKHMQTNSSSFYGKYFSPSVTEVFQSYTQIKYKEGRNNYSQFSIPIFNIQIFHIKKQGRCMPTSSSVSAVTAEGRGWRYRQTGLRE